MAKPLDNPAGAAVRALEPSVARSEPIVEFSRKKSPSHATESFDDRPLSSQRDLGESELTPLQLANRSLVALPRDNSRPLVTAKDRYAGQILDAYNGLRTRILRLQASRGFRSIAISSVGRSEGKTVTAFNLACCCAHVENFKVLLIDGDLRNRTLTTLIGGLPKRGLADVMTGLADYEEVIVRTDLPNLFVMGAGKSETAPADLFSGERWGEVVRRSEQHFKMVVVDGLSVGAFADFELLAPECDGVLMVVRARNASKDGLKNVIEQLDPNKLVGIVWNGDSREDENFYS